MSEVTIQNLPETTYRALEAQAVRHGRSIEAEMHHILETAILPETHLKLGSTLADNSRRLGLTNRAIGTLDLTRKRETGGAPIDAIQLRSLTACTPPTTQTAADLVRSMRDEAV